jgi:hypothetical protein
MKNHSLWMILGCVLPLLLIFFAPALGLGGNLSLFIFIVVMFAFHLMVPMHHRGHANSNHDEHNKTRKNESN